MGRTIFSDIHTKYEQLPKWHHVPIETREKLRNKSFEECNFSRYRHFDNTPKLKVSLMENVERIYHEIKVLLFKPDIVLRI